MLPQLLFLASLVSFLVQGVTSTPTLVDHSIADTTRKRAATCTPKSAGSASKDDVPAIVSALQECGNGGVIVLPKDVTYMIRSKLSFAGCTGCEIRLDGRLKLSDDYTYWNNSRIQIEVGGVKGIKFHSPLGTGEIDGNGQSAWDRFGQYEDLKRPVLFAVEGSTDVEVKGFLLKNAQNVFVNIGTKSERVKFIDMDLTAISKSSYRARHTDGFDIGESKYTTLSNIYIQNEDDCVAFKPGCDQVTVTDITCQGSHGLSVGSLAKSNKNIDSVTNVYVKNAIMKGATKAAGIKIYPGGPDHGTAIVRNVTWDGVAVDDCGAAFEFDACYNEDESYCEKNPSTSKVTEIYVKNFSGKTSTKYAPKTGHVFCPVKGKDCDIHFENWNIESGKGSGELLCKNIDSGVLGIACKAS